MLRPINGLEHVNYVQKVNQSNNIDLRVSTKTLENDQFIKNSPSFKGIKLSTLTRQDGCRTIQNVKKGMNESLDSWKEKLFNDQYKYLKEHREKWQVNGRGGQTAHADMNDPVDRTLMGIVSLGLSEIRLAAENAGLKNQAKDYVNQMVSLRSDLASIKLAEELAEIRKQTDESGFELIYEKSIKDVIDNEVKPKIIFPMQRIIEHKPTEMPNCIMLASPNKSINSTLTKYIQENANGTYQTLLARDVLEVLEECEQNYQKTGEWNLIDFAGLEHAINPNKAKTKTIAMMKDLMSSCAEDYHTTLLFRTTDPSKLDQIALQPHRVKRINTDNVVTVNDLRREAAEKRLESSSYLAETPISAVNDLLLLSNNLNKKLMWESSESDYNEIKNLLEKEGVFYDKYSDKINNLFSSLDKLY